MGHKYAYFVINFYDYYGILIAVRKIQSKLKALNTATDNFPNNPQKNKFVLVCIELRISVESV